MLNPDKRHHLDWLVQLYSHHPDAITDDAADPHLFDRHNDFGIAAFLEGFRPLNKLREQRGPVVFELGAIDEAADDLVFVELLVEGELIYVARVRFEVESPCRIKYWGSYPPLPEGVVLRDYQPGDAAGCVALEQLCPFESSDGVRWTINKGAQFDDYLKFMSPIDAAVVEFNDEIIGFFSCALRPIRFNDQDCNAVYQHHYRVHPDHRSGSVSVALASYVDPRRTFEHDQVEFPYSMIDPDNVHMQNMGFPPVPDLRVARLTLPLETLAADAKTSTELQTPTVSAILHGMNSTHEDRVLFPTHTEDYLTDRWNRISSFNQSNYMANDQAFIGVWQANERNQIEDNGSVQHKTIAYVIDYAFSEPAQLLEVLQLSARQLQGSETSHFSVLCDTRATEYAVLKDLADHEALLALHTLPWICEPLSATTLYCDGIYF